ALNGIFKDDGEFNCEPFHMQRDEFRVGEETPPGYFNRILEQYRITYNGIKIQGVKIIFSQFHNIIGNIRKDKRYRHFSVKDILESFPAGTQYIIIKRKDIRKQAVSYLKAVKGMGWSYQGSSLMRATLYHPSEIDPMIDKINRENKALRSLIKETNIRPLYMSYESLSRNFEKNTKNVFQFLDLIIPQSIDIQTSYQKQHDYFNVRMLKEYDLYRKTRRMIKRSPGLISKSLSLSWPTLNQYIFFASIVWLLAKNHWKIVLGGICASYLFRYSYFVPAFIQIPFSRPIRRLMEKDYQWPPLLLSFISSALISLFDLCWLVVVFVIVARNIENDPLPYLLFAYGVATLPFIHEVPKSHNTTNLPYICLTQTCFLVLILSYFFHWPPYSIGLVFFLLFLRHLRCSIKR
ncbi:MAG: hypothetical protein KGK03_08685, partial [Candidatus Omnitrophica bacterium]|nr:hypothetical protein [Candidatus Omnitrophota bacterium]